MHFVSVVGWAGQILSKQTQWGIQFVFRKKFYQNMLLDSVFPPSKTEGKNSLFKPFCLSESDRKRRGTTEHSKMKKKISE